MQLTLRLLPEVKEKLIATLEGNLQINVAGFRNIPEIEFRKFLSETYERALVIARERGEELKFIEDFRPLALDFRNLIDRPEVRDPIDDILNVVATFQHRAKLARSGDGRRGPGRAIAGGTEIEFPDYDVDKHGALVRYGVVELRVVQNYLLDRDELRAALTQLVPKLDDETHMYGPAHHSGHLAADDPEFNLRVLMTNAGFYVQRDTELAWMAVESWAEGYISALATSHLAWHNAFAPYYLKIQTELRRKYSVIPAYVRSPSAFKVYENLRGRRILLVSALAHLINEQVASGRVFKLYKNYNVPNFSLRAIPAWISTWPNRPHSDWRETFQLMCRSIEAEYRREPFDLFIASSGCYGLPICNFVRTQFGCPVLYIGHFANVAFGIRQKQHEFNNQRVINSEMWISSDLGRFPNVAQIDGGRYV